MKAKSKDPNARLNGVRLIRSLVSKQELYYVWLPAFVLALYYSFLWPSILALIYSLPKSYASVILERAATLFPLTLLPVSIVLLFLIPQFLSKRKDSVMTGHRTTDNGQAETISRLEAEPIQPPQRMAVRAATAKDFHSKTLERKITFSSPEELLSYFYGKHHD